MADGSTRSWPDPVDPRITHVFPADTRPEHRARAEEFVRHLAKLLVETWRDGEDRDGP
jgi:hypothetical protein